MATGTEWSCPICRDASDDIAYVSSCLHQFCRGCILRWVRKNPSCPLCRRVVYTLIYLAPPDQGLVEMAVPQPRAALRAGPRAERRPAGPLARARVAGFPPETWAHLFRSHAEILRPLELWLNEVLCGACWWDVAFTQGRVVAGLCRYGLHEEALVRELQPFLHEQTTTFVRQLIEVAADQCRELALRRMDGPGPRAAQGLQDSPAASLEGAAATSAEQREPQREPQGEPQGEPGRAVAEAAGPGQSGAPRHPPGQPCRRQD